MRGKAIALFTAGVFVLASIAGAQSNAVPSDAANATGNRIDLYFSDWHASTPHMANGSLEEREILTHGDGVNPTRKGAVLRFANSYNYATLASHTATKATRLDGQQEIYFVASGRGTATAGGQSADLYRNVAVLMPANLEFVLKNTGDEPLTMYVVNEPTPPGFRPNSAMLVRDENMLPITSSDEFWTHIVKTIFVTSDGLATLQAVLTVTLDPLTIARPHLHLVDYTDTEEVWSALNGSSLAFVGNQLREQTPGMAFYHIPDSQTPHTNLNPSEDSQAKFFYFARYHPHEARK
jgi:mannose-6-phosphate isomerase-like protein (cupin superfamily)